MHVPLPDSADILPLRDARFERCAPQKQEAQRLPSLAAFWQAVNPTGYSVERSTIEQPLFHARPEGPRFRQMVDILTPKAFRKESPVLVVTTGEFALGDGALVRRLFTAYGNDPVLPWSVVATEHRGFGASVASPDHQNIPHYVTSQEATQDFRRCLLAVRAQFAGPIFLYGGSYSANLALQVASVRPVTIDALVLSSVTIDFPFLADCVDEVVEKNLGAALYADFARHVAMRHPAPIGSSAWVEREFIQIVAFYLALHPRYQYLLPHIGMMAKHLSTRNFINGLFWVDKLAAGGDAWAWAASRGAKDAVTDAAGGNKNTGRVYAWQQCYELGGFFHTPPSKREAQAIRKPLFPQSEQEYLTYAKSLFQHSEPLVATDYAKLLAELDVPTLCVSGGRDPWLDLCPRPEQKARYPQVEFLFTAEAFHIPDLSDPATATKVSEFFSRYLPRS